MFKDKYLRWGIPGWVFLTAVFVYFGIMYPKELLEIFIQDTAKTIGLTAGFVSVGLPIGYLINQVYFYMFWIRKKQDISKITNLIDNYPTIIHVGWINSYYYLEYIWERELSKRDPDRRDFIKDKYRFLLSYIHSLGGLALSLALSLLVTVYLGFILKWSNYLLYPLILQLVLIFITFRIYIYFKNNLNFYQGYILNDLFNENKQMEISTE